MISNASGHGVAERANNSQECPQSSPQILKGLNRGLWTLDSAQLCVGWKEPGLGASWFRFNVGLIGCVH